MIRELVYAIRRGLYNIKCKLNGAVAIDATNNFCQHCGNRNSRYWFINSYDENTGKPKTYKYKDVCGCWHGGYISVITFNEYEFVHRLEEKL